VQLILPWLKKCLEVFIDKVNEISLKNIETMCENLRIENYNHKFLNNKAEIILKSIISHFCNFRNLQI